MMYSDEYNSSTMSRPGGNDSALNALLTQYSRTAVKTRFKEQDMSHKIAQPVINQILQEMKRSGGVSLQEPVLVESQLQGQSIGTSDYLTFGVPITGPGMHGSIGRGSTPSHQRYYTVTCKQTWVNEEEIEVDEDYVIPRSGTKKQGKETDSCGGEGVLLNAEVVKSSVLLSPPDTGYTCIVGETFSEHQPTLCFDGAIIPVLARRKLKESLTSAIQHLGLQGTVTQSQRGQAVTFRIKERHHHSITVELVPMINLPTDRWLSDTTWPQSGSRWPASRKVDRIKGIGHRYLATKDFDWELDYVLCEDELMKDIDGDGGCRREAYQVLQKLNEAFWCDASKNLLSSHMLQSLLFWECDRYPNAPDWSPSHLATRVISMTSQLHEHVTKRTLPLFMNPQVNMLADRKVNQAQELVAAANNIREFLEFAVGKLQLAMGACAAFDFD